MSPELPRHVHADWKALSHIVSTLVQSQVLVTPGQTIAIRFDLMDEGLHDFVLFISMAYTPSQLRTAKIEDVFDPFAGEAGAPVDRVQTFRLATARLLARLLHGDVAMAPIASDGLQIAIRIPVKKAESD